MARCRCQSENCPCTLRAGSGTTVTGAGTTESPWLISALPPPLTVQSTLEVTLDRGGAGTVASPYNLTATLPWVNPFGGTVGYVLTQQADGTFAPGPPAVVAAGAVRTGFGLTGDGTAAKPLRVSAICTYAQLKAMCA